MMLLTILGISYALFLLLDLLIVYLTIKDTKLRGLFVLMGALLPFLMIWSLVISIFNRGDSPGTRVSPEMATVEDEIECERVRIFGGEKSQHSFSEHVNNSYRQTLERITKKTYEASKKIGSYEGVKIGA